MNMGMHIILQDLDFDFFAYWNNLGCLIITYVELLDHILRGKSHVKCSYEKIKRKTKEHKEAWDMLNMSLLDYVDDIIGFFIGTNSSNCTC
jgi:uncharacterized lipoprotein YehR (DUF1307 family)